MLGRRIGRSEYLPFRGVDHWLVRFQRWEHSADLTQPYRLLDHKVVDLAELLLPGQRETLRQVFSTGPEHFVPEFIPQSVSLGDPLVLLQLVHDLIHHRLQRRLQVSVLFLSLGGLQLIRQEHHELFVSREPFCICSVICRRSSRASCVSAFRRIVC